jgi:protein involved in polysaccharide export with SLBB domain
MKDVLEYLRASGLRWQQSPAQAVAAACAAVLAAGCSQAPPHDQPAAAAPVAQTVQPIPYKLDVGDDVEVKFYYTPELNEHQPIRPDGMISMPLIDDVHAAGLSVEELRTQLRAAYSKQLLKPELEVVVAAVASARVFVGGEVVMQGAQPLVGGTTVSRAIMEAQGLKPTAYSKEVLLIHPGPDGRPLVRKIDVHRILTEGDTRDDAVLSSQDIVFVPRTLIANADIFVDQYIRQLLPFSATLAYNITPVAKTVP